MLTFDGQISISNLVVVVVVWGTVELAKIDNSQKIPVKTGKLKKIKIFDHIN